MWPFSWQKALKGLRLFETQIFAILIKQQCFQILVCFHFAILNKNIAKDLKFAVKEIEKCP